MTYKEVTAPDHIGWLPCPYCQLPIRSGSTCYVDAATGVGGCSKRCLEELLKLRKAEVEKQSPR